MAERAVSELPRADEAEFGTPRCDRVAGDLRRLASRHLALDELGAALARGDSLAAARAITHAPIWNGGRRPAWFGSLDIRALLIAAHRQSTLNAAVAEVEQAYPGQAPSRSSVHRFWQKLDQLRAELA